MEVTNYVELAFIFAAMIFSLISIVGSLVIRRYYHKRIALEYLGWGILLCAVWDVTNFPVGQTLFYYFPVVSKIAYFAACLMPIPFLFYMDEVQKWRYHKWYRIVEILITVECIVFFGLYYFHLYDFKKQILSNIICIALFASVTLFTILFDALRGYIKEYFIVAAAMVCMWLVVHIKGVSYIMRGHVENDVALPTGLIIILLLAIVNTIRAVLDMERRRQQAIMASEAKGKFLANMSHEIRTPINAVLGMDEMILRECTDVSIREYALDIQNAGQSLLALINDVLDLSKIESGKLEILPEEYDLSSLLHDIMNMITMKAKDKGLTVQLSVDEKLPSGFWGDDIRLRQILVNIMNNAVKYTEKGGVTLTVTGAELKGGDSTSKDALDNSSPQDNSSSSDERVCALTFRVQDTGIGIRQEDLAKLFSEFERIEEERNRNIEGTGLGMSITTQLLEMMGSKLEVESVYGEGSTFYFTLEQKIINAEPIGDLGERIKKRATEYSYRETFTAPEAQVLVVDDNAVNRKVFANLLKITKVKIDEVAGGMECLRMVMEKQYDVIFLDHMMPDLNGIETLHRLKELEDCPCHSTPVIVLTANAVSGAKEMYLQEGFDSFLSKPINPDKLEKMLIQYLPENKIIFEEIAVGPPEGVADGNENDIERSEEGGMPEELPSLDGIDWEYALLHLKDMDILKDTMDNFYLAMDEEAEALEQFLQTIQDTSGESQKEAMEQFEIRVHAMKSNSAMIGAVPLSGVAKMLEYAARDGESQVLQAVTPVFLNEWRKMKTILRDYVDPVGEDDGTGGLPADWNQLRQYLHQIVEAMKDMDIDTADESMEQMKKYQYPERMKPVVDKLSLAVANIDVEQAEKWMGEMIILMDEMEEVGHEESR